MRFANWVVPGIVVATFFALLLAPEKSGYPLARVSLGIVGVWALWSSLLLRKINKQDV